MPQGGSENADNGTAGQMPQITVSAVAIAGINFGFSAGGTPGWIAPFLSGKA